MQMSLHLLRFRPTFSNSHLLHLPDFSDVSGPVYGSCENANHQDNCRIHLFGNFNKSFDAEMALSIARL